MAIKIGGIDVVQSIVDCQFRVAVLERIVDHLASRLPYGTLTPADLDRFRHEAFDLVKQRYPELGLEFKQTESGQ